MGKDIFDLEVATIRKALKTLCPSLSVRRGRGTAYMWIDIRGSGGKYGEFTEAEKQALEKFGLGYGINVTCISPEDTRYYVEKAAKLLGIELPEKLKNEYKERDEYKQRIKREAEERKRLQENCKHEWKLEPVIVFPFPDTHVLIRCPKCKKEQIVEKTKLAEYGVFLEVKEV